MSIAAGINLLTLVQGDTRLKKVATTQGGEYHGPCPRCGGRDRFIIQLNRKGMGSRWSCRACSDKWGDAIAYIQWHDGVDFLTACEILGLTMETRHQPRVRLGVQRQAPAAPALASLADNDYIALRDEEWQRCAWRFVEECRENLYHTPQGVDIWIDYLVAQRGISNSALRVHWVGWNPIAIAEYWGEHDVFLPRGIVLPWVDASTDQIYKVKFRLGREAKHKYAQVVGGANALYRALPVQPGQTVMLVEGEFDQLASFSELFPDIRPVATGSSEGARLTEWVAEIALAKHVLLAFDADPAGDDAAIWWQNVLGDIAVRLRPHEGMDICQMVAAGVDLRDWVASVGIKGVAA